MKEIPWYMQPEELKQELDHMIFCLGDPRKAKNHLRESIGVSPRRFQQLLKPLREEVTL
ncbi:hypothetical protein KbCgl_18730 [Corynebacterium glutamicum]|nr:hypothetical protein KbCgl_18730 [Corynebacterium glutamicum]